EAGVRAGRSAGQHHRAVGRVAGRGDRAGIAVGVGVVCEDVDRRGIGVLRNCVRVVGRDCRVVGRVHGERHSGVSALRRAVVGAEVEVVGAVV
ncbi:MAG: hypothetical protein AVDCRST_MAG17-1141, partial [uncultured Solirubrobacterales bacterium]